MTTWEERYPRLWAVMEWISVLVTGSLFFWLGALPVITLPATLVGLCAAVGPLVRPAPHATTRRFWAGFRRSFVTALLLGLVNLAAGLILYLDIRFFWGMSNLTGQVIAFAFGSLAMVAAMANVFAWPLLAWYPQPLGKLLRRSLLLAAAHPFLALGGLAGALLVPVLYVVLPGSAKGLVPALGPGLVALAFAFPARQAMKRYAGPEDEFQD